MSRITAVRSCRGCSAEMGAENGRQAGALLLAALLGLASGLLYDLLRPPRRVMRQPWAALTDLLYALSVGAGLFLFAMSAGDGRFGLWELTASLLGVLAYMHLLSPLLLPFFCSAARWIAQSLEMLGKPAKKFCLNAKKFFQKLKDCYIMKRTEEE